MGDNCWLKKQVKDSRYSTYYIEENDLLSKTISKEMLLMFKGIKFSNKDASIQFKVVEDQELGEEGYSISCIDGYVEVLAQTSKGLLYGMYGLYESIITNNLSFTFRKFVPSQSIRMINHWDNFDGTIERGYAGNSIFFDNNNFRNDEKIIRQYARLIVSTGINALSINNVNVHELETKFILKENLLEIKKIYNIFQDYGLKLFLSINFASPKIIGGLETADPLDPKVIRFWEHRVREIYEILPEFGGFVVKADSEGEPGPLAYGRTHADGANMFGEILKPYDGICIWRCFVYNHKQDWRDRSIDRAKAAYDHFMPLDGQFLDNVALQIKLGPLDFQVREPVSPLFGGLRSTNQIIEFQLTQEYTGQQKAVYYQSPVWKEALDFDTQYEYCNHTEVKSLLKINSPNKKISGICAVGVAGIDKNWTGHKLMQANLYAYGKLAWDNELSSKKIIDNWLKLTFDLSKESFNKIEMILTSSRETYELYTAPRGVGFMCKPHHHYGPDVDGYEYDRWGTYHYADRNGVGVDRTVNGTGFVRQYSVKRCEEYNSLERCPDELLLWFHHVPYTHVLHNGKTLIQDIYDNHFEGVKRVEEYIGIWKTMEKELCKEDYINVLERLEEQLRMAIEWRDQINTYFYRKSGIEDEKGRMIYP